MHLPYPYTGLLLLFFVSAIYLLAFPSKRDAKPKSVPKPANKDRKPRRQWSQYINELSSFLPLVIPKTAATRRQMLLDSSVVMACLAVDRLLKVASPVLLRQVVDLLSSNDPKTRRLPWVELVLFILCHNVLGRAANDVFSFFQRRITAEAEDEIDLRMYDKLLEQSAGYHENTDSASTWEAISHAGSSTIHYFSYLVLGQLPLVFDVILGVAACWTVFDATLALTMFVAIAAFVGVSWAQKDPAQDLRQDYIESIDQVFTIGPDTIRNWQTVSYFNRFGYERARYSRAIKTKRTLTDLYLRPLSWETLSKNSVACLGLGAVCLLGCYQIVHSDRSAGDFAMLFQFWTELFKPIDSLISIAFYADQFLAENHKIIEIMNLEPKVKDKPDAPDFKLGNGTIEFDHVKFSYDGKREIIKDVSFRLEGGKTVAIVGETGGGKSTMLKLLCRAYDATEGRIRVDGQDVRDVRLTTLRDHITIVPQSIGVFNTSVLENVRYANLEATKEQIEDACQAAALHDRIMSFTNGYDEKVGEKGVKLSGGELQRLAIARALLRKAQIILFDEATSHLDAETEDRIQAYLRKWYKGRTVIVVAHRLATVSNADMVISFKDGVVVEAGKHNELLANRGYFFQLWNKQRLLWEPTKQKGEEGGAMSEQQQGEDAT